MVDVTGLEGPPILKQRSAKRETPPELYGGREGTRTPGLVDANHALSQLSYTPISGSLRLAALGRFYTFILCAFEVDPEITQDKRPPTLALCPCPYGKGGLPRYLRNGVILSGIHTIVKNSELS